MADLCCRIGGDSIALAERGPVTGIDLNPATVLLAEANLRALAGDEGASEAVFREKVDDPLMASFEVADALPFDRKRLRKLFRERGVGRLEIRTRGIKESPEQVRRDLRLQGSGEVVLFLARLGRRVIAMVATRIHHEP